MLSRASAPAAPHVQLRNKRSFPVAQLTRLNNRHKARLATLLVATSFARIVCSMGRDDPDGFDPVADTVGAGIYGGRVKLDANGKQVWGRQYCGHCRGDGPVYDGSGYTEISDLIHRGDLARIQALCSEKPHLINEQMTGGATPLHVCGMSRRGQLATEAFIKLGADLNVHDTCGGYTALGRMASNNLAIGAEALLKAGARWNIENHAGDTPLMTAQMSSAWDVVEVLKKYGAEY